MENLERNSVSAAMREDFAIEKNIAPLPTKQKKKSGRKTIYPFAKMELNDSFFVPYDNPALMEQKVRSIYYSMRHYKITHENSVDFRIVPQPEEKGIRVWRIL